MTSQLDHLRLHLAEIHDLEKAAWLLSWDQQTMMPARGGAVRSAQIATLAKVAHERFTDDRTGRLLDAAASETATQPADGDDASLVRVARRDWEKARRIPADLIAEMTLAAGEGFAIWVSARASNDFTAYAPVLTRHLELKQRYIALFPDAAEPYDPLFDDVEPGMTAADIRAVFDPLKAGLIPLARQIAANPDAVDASMLHQSFPAADQERLCRQLIEPWGFTADAWRLDPTYHPFASSIATTDIRLTTRYDEGYLGAALFGTLHECGHGLYEAGVDPALERTPLCQGASLSLHESQSRLWENLVGRSRRFWDLAGPVTRQAFPVQLGDADDETLFRAVNRMSPSLIRVEADEATYSLHIIIRFEVEQELLAGRLAVAELPEAWNAKFEEYLGISVPDDTRGVLQDVHWSSGSFGTFPVYAIGNVIAGQIWERLILDLPDLEQRIARGDFTPLRAWLADHLYRHGRKFTPRETIRLVTGGDLDPAPYLRYVSDKVTALYGAA